MKKYGIIIGLYVICTSLLIAGKREHREGKHSIMEHEVAEHKDEIVTHHRAAVDKSVNLETRKDEAFSKEQEHANFHDMHKAKIIHGKEELKAYSSHQKHKSLDKRKEEIVPLRESLSPHPSVKKEVESLANETEKHSMAHHEDAITLKKEMVKHSEEKHKQKQEINRVAGIKKRACKAGNLKCPQVEKEPQEKVHKKTASGKRKVIHTPKLAQKPHVKHSKSKEFGCHNALCKNIYCSDTQCTNDHTNDKRFMPKKHAPEKKAAPKPGKKRGGEVNKSKDKKVKTKEKRSSGAYARPLSKEKNTSEKQHANQKKPAAEKIKKAVKANDKKDSEPHNPRLRRGSQEEFPKQTAARPVKKIKRASEKKDKHHDATEKKEKRNRIHSKSIDKHKNVKHDKAISKKPVKKQQKAHAPSSQKAKNTHPAKKEKAEKNKKPTVKKEVSKKEARGRHFSKSVDEHQETKHDSSVSLTEKKQGRNRFFSKDIDEHKESLDVL